jgi:hypothetical protein
MWLIPPYPTSAVGTTSLKCLRTGEKETHLGARWAKTLERIKVSLSDKSIFLIFMWYDLCHFYPNCLQEWRICVQCLTRKGNDDESNCILNYVIRYQDFTFFTNTDCLKCVQNHSKLTRHFKVMLLSHETWAWQIQPYDQTKHRIPLYLTTELSALYYTNIIKATIFISVWLHLYLFQLPHFWRICELRIVKWCQNYTNRNVAQQYKHYVHVSRTTFRKLKKKLLKNISLSRQFANTDTITHHTRKHLIPNEEFLHTDIPLLLKFSPHRLFVLKTWKTDHIRNQQQMPRCTKLCNCIKINTFM